MKKKIILSGICIALTLTCIFVFAICKSNTPADFSSLQTALQKKSTFAIHNYNTDNVYILQANKKKNLLSLYRKQADGCLLRYTFSDDTITTDITKNGQWQQYSRQTLPASPFLLIDEVSSLLNGKSKSTSTIRLYADLLISAFSTVYDDSVLLINYDNLPTVINEITSFLKNRDTRKMIGNIKEISATEFVSTITPFENPTVTEQIIAILSEAVQPLYKETIHTALLQTCNTMNGYSFQITTSLIGNFISLEICKNGKCVFTVEKLK